MTLNLNQLSPADFEDLTRDIIGADLKVRFEAFGPGPDGGIDGWYSKAKKSVILQAKHYVGSKFSDLLKAAKVERVKIGKIKPTRYIFVTSLSLTPKQKNTLGEELKPYLKSESDIWGYKDIEAFLRLNPEIHKAHIKLW